MSGRWRYVSEARGHVVELYELLIGMPREPNLRYPVGTGPTQDEQARRNSKTFDLWADKKAHAVCRIVETLDSIGEARVSEFFADWREHSIDFVGKTPSARGKLKLQGQRDRTLLICSALWYARMAVSWLTQRDDEGLLRAGPGYREQTKFAASNATVRRGRSGVDLAMLPEEAAVLNRVADDRRKAESYAYWSYSMDADNF